jgi:large subunit ribosomal protein L17
MLANLVCSLIEHKRVTTTLAKAKAARSVAEKMVTLSKSGTIHDRRLATAHLKYNPRRMQPTKALVKKARENDVIRILFEEIAPAYKDRRGGYTRIIKLRQRQGDAADLAILEWVELPSVGPAPAPETAKAEPATPTASTQPAAEPKKESESK